MSLRVVGAGLPRTGTASLKTALEQLLGAPCYHMRDIPEHPFDLGDSWHGALRGRLPDWDTVYDGYAAAVDWPTSLFWRELSVHYPTATVLLSVRDSAETWWESADVTILPVARGPRPGGPGSPNGLVELLQRFTGREQWDDPRLLMDAYDAHVAAVRAEIEPQRLVEWRAEEGWQPLCRALGVPVPDDPFPHSNRRSDWR
jgi:hypothetical protein